MTKENLIVTEKGLPVHFHYRIHWSAIFAGAFVGLGLAFLLHLYGMAISLSVYSSSTQGGVVIAVGGLLGMLVGVIAAMVAAGFVSGYLGRHHYYHLHGGVVYGFVTWSLILVISAIAAGPLMHYVSLYESSLSHSVVIDNAARDVTNKAKAPVVKQNKNTSSSVAVVTPKELAWSSWIIFGLFFIGALSCCIGACWGMSCKREDE